VTGRVRPSAKNEGAVQGLRRQLFRVRVIGRGHHAWEVTRAGRTISTSANQVLLCVAVLILASCTGRAGGSPTTDPTIRPTVGETGAPTPAPTVVVPATAIPHNTPTGRILFTTVAPSDSVASIYVVNADGSGRTDLTPSGGGGGEPEWSPDGTMIAFVRDGIWVMRADGTGARQVRHDPTMFDEWPVWSPDGRRIAYLEAPACDPCDVGVPWTLNIMDADGSSVHKVADVPSPTRPAWSPDGQAIAFEGEWSDPPTQANGLQSIRLDGSGRHQLTNGPDSFPDWSTDGRLAFLRAARTAVDGTILDDLVVSDGDVSSTHEVTLPIVIEGPLAWSPDGQWIAMTGTKSLPILGAGQWDIWIARPDGTGLVAVTDTPDLGEGSSSWR
jgi:dipeptidyl aminopeptidase/acylaminoacyl peptidase